MRVALVVVAALLGGAGCAVEMEEESLRIGAVVADCVLPVPPEVTALGAPVSLDFADGSLWIFGSTELTAPNAAGAMVLPNAAALVRTVADACAGRLDFVRDASGAPQPLVPLLPEEEQANAARTDGRFLDITPQGGFVHDRRGVLYYQQVLRGPGIFDAEVLGVGVCLADGPGTPCVRDATLVFAGSTPAWGGSGVVGDDGYAYVTTCFHAAAFEDLCGVARVPPDEAADPAAYAFYSVFGEWTTDPRNFSAVITDATRVTPGRDPALGRFTAVFPDIWESTIVLRLARDPWGGFGFRWRLFEAVPPDDWFIGGGVEHAALRSADGLTLAVTYSTTAAAGPAGLHLVTVRLDAEALFARED